MSGILPEKALNFFLYNPVYENDGFEMWGCILEKYDPRGKDALSESVSALCALEKGPPYSIINYMSHTLRLFSGIQGINLNTMERLFFTVNANCDRFGALTDRF